MKRIICLLLIFALVPVCALGADLDLFNDYAAVFGVPELKDGTFDGKYTIFNSEGCTIYFREMEDDLIIYVEGDGVSFFAYSVAAIMSIEPDSSAFAENCGIFLSNFLLQNSTAQTKAGNLIVIQKRENGYMFAVNRK